VELAMQGDHEAFSALAAASVDRLYSAATLILRDRSSADDAVQDALVRAWVGLPRLRDPGRFEAWLHRLLVNACYDIARTRSRRRAEVQLLPAHEPSVGDPSTGVVDREAIDRAFRRLSVEHRTALVLRHYIGLSVPEIARAMSVPVGTGKSRLHHAEQRLRTAIEADSRAGGRSQPRDRWSA
jgi:RNA polymerase sigma-70 factor, ECF subfamily